MEKELKDLNILRLIIMILTTTIILFFALLTTIPKEKPTFDTCYPVVIKGKQRQLEKFYKEAIQELE